MSRLRLLFGLLPALPLAASCSSSAPVPIALVMDTPQGLLEEATTVELAVFDASGATCEATGAPSRIPASAQRFSLQNTGCTGGAAWCTTITLDKDGSDKMFAVVAESAAGVLAQGCTTALINQDPLVVSIQVLRYVKPACCNDGIVEAGEECDTGVVAPMTCSGAPGGACKGITADFVCGCDCTANEILLSIDDAPSDPRLSNGPAGTKTNLALAFGVDGTTYPAALLGLFVNSDSSTDTSGPDINARFLAQDLNPIADPAPLALQLTMPLSCGDLEGHGLPGNQGSPRLALVGTTMAAVYSSDGRVGGTLDVVLNPLDSQGCAPDTQCTAATSSACGTGLCDATCGSGMTCCSPSVPVNSMGSSPGIEGPDIAAGPPNAALVVWTYQNASYYRIWQTDGTFVPPIAQKEMEIASNASFVRAAGSPSGWLVAYNGAGPGDGDGVFLNTISPTGTLGSPTLVNTVTQGTQDQPAIAALSDGSSLVAWRSGGNIFFQRFDATGAPVAGDQDAPLNTSAMGGMLNPTVGAGPDFFTVAWETGSADVYARYVGGGAGFGYNTISGQNGDFEATSPSVMGQRHNPSVAVGSYVAFGWEDDSTAHPGVYVRRFPLPTF
jgi:hypothetical protein